MPNKPNQKRTYPKMSDEDFERFYADIYEEFGPQRSAENTDLLKDVPVTRIPSEFDEQPVPETDGYDDVSEPAGKVKGTGGLWLLICLELLGIAAVAGWWILRLM